MRRIIERTKGFLFPTRENVYRPGVLGKNSLLIFLGIILAAEGFLTANLFGRSSVADFLAAVIGSEIISLTNTERAQAAAPDLTENQILDAAAQRKAEDMAAQEYFSHVGPDGKQPWAWISEVGYDYAFAGENLAVRFVDSRDVVEAWMGSPTHRANITRPVYREIGVGVAQGTYKGASATFVVQFFGTPRKVAAASAPVAPNAEKSLSPASGQGRNTSENNSSTSENVNVAGESIAAPAAAAVHPSSLSETLLRTFARIFAEPRSTTAWILGSVAILLSIALALTFLVHIQIQPGDLLLRGSLLVFLALFLIAANGQILGGSGANQNQAAAIGANGSETLSFSGDVVISERAESTERFVIVR